MPGSSASLVLSYEDETPQPLSYPDGISRERPHRDDTAPSGGDARPRPKTAEEEEAAAREHLEKLERFVARANRDEDEDEIIKQEKSDDSIRLEGISELPAADDPESGGDPAGTDTTEAGLSSDLPADAGPTAQPGDLLRPLVVLSRKEPPPPPVTTPVPGNSRADAEGEGDMDWQSPIGSFRLTSWNDLYPEG